MGIEKKDLLALVDKATAGDEKALEAILLEAQGLVQNLSLRMLGSFPDAEDATQEILLKILTRLSTFKKALFPLGCSASRSII